MTTVSSKKYFDRLTMAGIGTANNRQALCLAEGDLTNSTLSDYGKSIVIPAGIAGIRTPWRDLS